MMPPLSPKSSFSGWRILVFATIALGLTGPGQTIGVSVFIDHFAEDLNLSKNAIASGYAIGTLCGALAMPTVGLWIDRYGVRRAMTITATLFAGALFYMSGVQGIISLTIGFWFIRMLGQGSLSLVSNVAVSLWFEQRRGLALGLTMTISSAMMALVPVGLSFTIAQWGWRTAWIVSASTVAMVVIPLAWFGIIDRPSSVGQHPDGLDPHPDPQKRAAVRPSMDRSAALRTRAFWVLAAASGGASMLSTGLNFHQIALLGESGFSQTEAAIMFLPQVVGTSVGSPLMGVALDKIGARFAPLVSLLLLSATLLLASQVSTLPAVICYAVLFGLMSGTVRTLGAALVPKWFGLDHIGSIQGALMFIGVLASAIGPIAFSVTASATGSFRSTALLWAALPLVGAVFAATNHPSRRVRAS